MYCVFVVRASSQIGIGHLMRCLALAQAMQESQFVPVFLLDAETQAIANNRKDWYGDIIAVDYQQAADSHIQALHKNQQSSVDWVIIDGYAFDYAYCHLWQQHGFKVALFDDGIHSAPYGADLLINASASVSIATDGTAMLSGADYRLLRREFYNVSQPPIDHRPNLTISFGGSDPANLTLPLLMLLEQRQFDGSVSAITGQAYPLLTELNQFLASTSLNVEHIHGAQNMADVWSNAKLAVSAAGGSQFELAVCATPSILVVVADNQLSASQNAAEEGWCVVANMTHLTERDQQLLELCTAIENLWNNQQILAAMQQSILGKYNALGATRVLASLGNYDE